VAALVGEQRAIEGEQASAKILLKPSAVKKSPAGVRRPSERNQTTPWPLLLSI
jgi:hypothetical protein